MSDALIFKGKPTAKPRMTRADAWKKRKCVLDYWEFKDEINRQARKQGFTLYKKHKVKFLYPMPKSWSKKKKNEFRGQDHEQRPDMDNFVKALWDCLLNEDSSCSYLVASKKWADEGSISVENFPKNLLF